MSRDAFGPNLRRIRVQKGISIEYIAEQTKITSDLLHGLERNDFARWPAGIFARAYVRQYATAIGVDPDATVDEFCRWFPQGDRRAERLIREQSDIVGHDLAWRDDLAKKDAERRGASARPIASAHPIAPSMLAHLFLRLRRAFGKA
jgi:transcriptional regulator with XRE-family HTH domain